MGGGKPLTTPSLLSEALSIGLTLADLDNVTIGIVLDICAERTGNVIERAAQADFDNF
jgi:hypothetical protein